MAYPRKREDYIIKVFDSMRNGGWFISIKIIWMITNQPNQGPVALTPTVS